ncbi:hypothetical protein [Pseudorhizobium banfieldiae]|uniref:hypothetical protein n=1 Tax=Pseudorhizobium banfieldiae TaxID=1125847 RepID=UPI000B1E9E87|nr:hypothetical protein [Pseudorhizobium banfieldiae]CAD6606158.1 hypothetical protein RNT25_01799 [arsenite-oxidising bacterium NT-25]
MTTPSKSDRDDFAAFCRNATTAQLSEIIRRETIAGRDEYAAVAREELNRRMG